MDEYLAKPTGITLQQHLKDVEEEAGLCVSRHPFVQKKYSDFCNGKSLFKRATIAAKYHDEGKKHPKWQEACKKDFEEFKKTNYKILKANHLKKVNLRHEIHSLILLKKKDFSDPVKAAIAAHHKKLSHRHQSRWSDDELNGAQELWTHFKKISNQFYTKENLVGNLEDIVKSFYEFSGVRYFTQLADHRASIKENLKESDRFVPDIKNFEYTFPIDWEKRNVQKIVEENFSEELLLLRAPTGAGKTEASLLWAKKQIESGKADRLVIAMPTRFTSNALSLNIESKVSETGLYHSSSWFVKHHDNAELSIEDRSKETLIHEFSRFLESPVTVCTIDHLLASVTLSREEHHGILFNLCNSCLVIDESDFYDDFCISNIQILLKILRIMKVPILMMSATLPDSFKSLYGSIGFENLKIHEDKSEENLERCEIVEIEEFHHEDLEPLVTQIKKNLESPIIVYVNTVGIASKLYESLLKQEELQEFGNNIVLYHSRFTEPDKKLKEELLLKNFGREAWAENRAKGIAILTQIGELSVNISSDIMISELCPIDRLVQRVGRLSRFSRGCGKLFVFAPFEKSELYPAPYGTFELSERKWIPNPYLLQTRSLLKKQKYSSKQFVDLVNLVYKEVPKFSDKAKDNAKELEKYFKNNWLILPAEQMDDESEATQGWKSRDIGDTITIFVKEPESFFQNYMDYQKFKNLFGVSIPYYILKMNESLVRFKTICIREEKMNIYFVEPDCYNSTKGLLFPDSQLL